MRISIMGRIAIMGDAKIWRMKPMAMKVMAMPARAESRAARGVCLRIQSPTKAPATSITPEIRVANRPACQARCQLPVSRYTGPMIKNT